MTKEEGLVTIIFNDRSKLQIKIIGMPDANVLGESRIVGIGEEGDRLILFGEQDRAAEVQVGVYRFVHLREESRRTGRIFRVDGIADESSELCHRSRLGG